MVLDVAIIGGSFAGMSAALQLARARRKVGIFDDGLRRNRFAATSHGFLAQDGRPPSEIVAQAREQLARYPTVEWIGAKVSAVDGGAATSFGVRTEGGVWQARRVLLATGVVDHLPPIPGLQERWGRSVFHCPYCHGYELEQGAIGVIATGPVSLHQAMLLAEWGQVTLFLNGAVAPDEEERNELARRGVRIDAAVVAGVTEHATVLLQDGRRAEFAGLFTASRTEAASPLAVQLGCEHEEGPLGRFVRTGPMKETSVPGVFACGDLGRAAGNVALAVGDGAMAGAAAHRSLVFGG